MAEFCNDYIRINDHGMDLLRNRFPYFHIDYHHILSVKIESGYLLKNRVIPLIAGIVFVVIALKLMAPALIIYGDLPGNPNVHSSGRGIAIIFLLPLSLMGIGWYFIIESMRRSQILWIETESNQYNIRIKEFERPDNMQDLINYLNDKIKQEVEIID